MKRVMDGQIGEIVAIETTYNSQGVWEPRKTREQCSSDMEYQMRNWYYYSWLSGDHIVEQAVHGIDTIAWVMNDKPPLKCWGLGGRQSRTDPKYGNIWDHFSVVYEYPGNVRGYHHCRHWVNTPPQVKDYVFGTTGTADVFDNAITGANKWQYRGSKNHSMYQVEHDEMFAAIRAGKPINNGEKAAASTSAGPDGPNRRVHGRNHHSGDDPQLQGKPESCQLRIRHARHAPHSGTRYNQIRLRASYSARQDQRAVRGGTRPVNFRFPADGRWLSYAISPWYAAARPRPSQLLGPRCY